jgi:DNA repair protein RecN (Recombination protein N)
MLTQLCIQHYAIVEYLEIDFRSGMTAITGETGAGKSIILGALGLTLGDRADKSVISTNATRTDITACFDTRNLALSRSWLEEHDLLAADEPELCLLRRVVTEDGRSRAWVNGRPVSLQILKEIGEMLIDIHSQHEHQSLLNKSTHQRLLDEFIGQRDLLDEVRRLSREWKKNRDELEDLRQQSANAAAQFDLLEYQIKELHDLNLLPGEMETLESEYRELNSTESTLAGAQQLLELCSESEHENLLSGLNKGLALLQDLNRNSSALRTVTELLSTASIQVEEAVTELRRCIDACTPNPHRLEIINQRLADIQRLARKHRIKPEELPFLTAELQKQHASLTHTDEALAQKQDHDLILRQAYDQAARLLSELRRSAAEDLALQINQQISELGMSNANLLISLTPSVRESLSANGLENVEFLVSTNPGQEPRPLIRIASGGELSRISLAIQVITARTSAIPTLVFDEVDVGIGGGVARAVGRLLRELGGRGQVLCVTHQAQVASQGHHHLFVSKSGLVDNMSLGTSIRELSEQERVEEIARMLGGESEEHGLTTEALAHAQEMLSL